MLRQPPALTRPRRASQRRSQLKRADCGVVLAPDEAGMCVRGLPIADPSGQDGAWEVVAVGSRLTWDVVAVGGRCSWTLWTVSSGPLSCSQLWMALSRTGKRPGMRTEGVAAGAGVSCEDDAATVAAGGMCSWT